MFKRERRGSERNIKKYKSCQDLLITGVPAQLEKGGNRNAERWK